MAQFDIHRNPNAVSNDTYPYLLDVQSDLLDELSTRVVVPLARADVFGRRAGRLNPAFEVDGQPVVMATPLIAGIAWTALGERMGSLDPARDAIVAALDVLITGV